MKRIDTHKINAIELLKDTKKVTYAFRIIAGKNFGKVYLSKIQEGFILCHLKDVPESLQEAFLYKCILEKHHFLIQIVPNSLKVESLRQEEINSLLNKIELIN